MNSLQFNTCFKKLAVVLFGFLLFLFVSVASVSPAYAEIGDDVVTGDITVTIENSSNTQPNSDVETTIPSTLAKTSDVLPVAFAFAFLGTAILTCSVLYSKRKSLVTGAQHADTLDRASFIKMGIAISLAVLLASGIYVNRLALADNQVSDTAESTGGSNIADVSANIVCDDEGYVKEAELNITNKLTVDLQIENIKALDDFANILDNEVVSGLVLSSGESVHKTWTTENRIEETILQTIRESGGTYHASMNCNVKYNGFHAQFMTNDGTDLVFYDKFVPENQFAVMPSNSPSRAGYEFVEWNTASDGSGETVNDTYLKSVPMIANVKYYAIWNRIEAFMAEKSSDIDLPYKIYSGQDTTTKMISIEEVKKAADNIRAGVAVDTDIFSDTNDKWHLFVKVAGDGSAANDWLEMRIINIGSHDTDGAAITFQTTHALKDAVAFDSTYTDTSGKTPYDGNWETSTLKTYLNTDFVDSLPNSVKSKLVNVSKISNSTAGTKPNGGDTVSTTDKSWILSFTEYIDVTGTSNEWWTENSHDGSIYNYYASKHFETGKAPAAGSEQAIIIGALNKKRDGSAAPGMFGWQRSVSPNKNSEILMIYNSGNVSSYSGAYPLNRFYIAPSFAF